MFANLGVSFAACATDVTDGDLSAQVGWTSDLDGPIGNGAGFFTSTLHVGTHQVTATVADAGGLTASAVRTVVVRPPNTGDAGLLNRGYLWVLSAGLFILAMTFGTAGILAALRARGR